MKKDYPVTLLCSVLGVSPSGYHAWAGGRRLDHLHVAGRIAEIRPIALLALPGAPRPMTARTRQTAIGMTEIA